MQYAETPLLFERRHHFAFENVKILDQEGRKFKHNLSQMIHIKANKTVNFRSNVTVSTLFMIN